MNFEDTSYRSDREMSAAQLKKEMQDSKNELALLNREIHIIA
jgi:hypothetical protein